MARIAELNLRAITPVGPWIERAKCRGIGPELFYSEHESDQQKAARTMCAACPVRRQCLDYAISERIPDGIWGGLSETQRERIVEIRKKEKGACGVAVKCRGCDEPTVVVSGSWPFCSLPCRSRASRRI